MAAAAGRRLGEAEALSDGMRERNAIQGTAEHAL
jgi:hypothetical protein